MHLNRHTDLYRILEKGEIIQEGDEVDGCGDAWRDEPVWIPARCVGEHAPDPDYPSHRIYRRKIRTNSGTPQKPKKDKPEIFNDP